VRDFIEGSAARHPHKAALICGERSFTYAELNRQADCFAHALVTHGVKPGDRVVIHLPNSSEAVAAIFGVLKAGAVFVPVNPTVKAGKLAYVVENCRASALISELAFELCPQTAWIKLLIRAGESVAHGPKSSKASAGSRTGWLTFQQVQEDYPGDCPEVTNLESDLACLIYTSGSTGRPKGVMSEHRQVVFASGSIIKYLENTESDIVLNVVPLSFDYGLYQLLMTFRFGGTLVLEKSFAFPNAILSRMEEHHVTGFPGVPTIFALLLRTDLSGFDLSHLRYLTNTAAALAPALVLALRRKFPKARLYSMYGLTETKRALYLPPDELERRPGSVGVPIPGTQAWIEDAQGRSLKAGETGELVVCGPHVMRGYWENPAATNERFRPGTTPDERRCYTGDLFRQDNEGFFYFVGRKDDIIKSRGEKVAPKEVENVLYEIPGVAEATVVGISDPIIGQTIKAFIVCDGEQLTDARVLAYCRAHLEDFMVPQAIEFCDALPKTASGKIDKLELTRNGGLLRAQSAEPSLCVALPAFST
jgi:amino acid adenylation domain-containing protein